mmetsp:Transcript_33256/g.88012  ORF Transcript_33256/g.88012 Transcript_33256/m.88012 type:complete len:243 (+) Transcript_33256:402-1130(+)
MEDLDHEDDGRPREVPAEPQGVQERDQRRQCEVPECREGAQDQGRTRRRLHRGGHEEEVGCRGGLVRFHHQHHHVLRRRHAGRAQARGAAPGHRDPKQCEHKARSREGQRRGSRCQALEAHERVRQGHEGQEPVDCRCGEVPEQAGHGAAPRGRPERERHDLGDDHRHRRSGARLHPGRHARGLFLRLIRGRVHARLPRDLPQAVRRLPDQEGRAAGTQAGPARSPGQRRLHGRLGRPGPAL